MMHAPIRVITVEREYGSRGGESADDLAERLGWRLLDSELVSAAESARVFHRIWPQSSMIVSIPGITATARYSGTTLPIR